MDEIKNRIESYLGWPSSFVEKELFPFLREHKIRYMNNWPIIDINNQRYTGDKTHLFAYIFDEKHNEFHLYFCYPERIFDYVKFNDGYFGWKKLNGLQNKFLKLPHEKFNRINGSAELYIMDISNEAEPIEKYKK